MYIHNFVTLNILHGVFSLRHELDDRAHNFSHFGQHALMSVFGPEKHANPALAVLLTVGRPSTTTQRSCFNGPGVYPGGFMHKFLPPRNPRKYEKLTSPKQNTVHIPIPNFFKSTR